MAKINLTERLDPQPTLAFFLGGSGVKTGKQLLSMLESVPPEPRQLIETLFIDSEAPDVDIHTRSRHYCYRDLTMFDSPVYRAFRAHRMPSNLGSEPVMDSCDGCGITRIFGAASLAACRDDFLNFLSGAVARLKAQRSDASQGLQVFITASACGGTGAGMLIDAAALVRHHLAEALGERPRIFAFLLGPDAFVDDPKIPGGEQKERMQASAYALLKELHHFADGGAFESGYRLRDKPIVIRNDSQGDRLFEWIFYVDGKTEAGDATRSFDELTSIVAAGQLHLAMSEVGHKIRESLPNQREERSRHYAADYVHSENREGQSDEERAQLRTSARRSFLAGLAVRNIRFPAHELATLERARWTSEALAALLRRDHPEEEEQILIMDRLLGVEAGEVTGEGLLAMAGASEHPLAEHLLTDAWSGRRASTDPTAVHERGQHLLRMIEGMAHSPASPAPGRSEELTHAFRSWQSGWSEAMTSSGDVPQYLLQLAGDPIDGRGLLWLQSFLEHAIAFLEKPRQAPRLKDSSHELDTQVTDLQGKLRTLRNASKRDERNIVLRIRGLFGRLTGESQNSTGKAWSPGTKSRANRAAKDLDRLAEVASQLQRRKAAHALERLVFLQMADDLKTWRRDVLTPTLDALSAAKDRADVRRHIAEAKLERQGPASVDDTEKPGATLNLTDPALLDELRSGFAARLSVVDLVVRPFFDLDQGLIHDETRLSFETARELTTVAILDTVSSVISRASHALLARLEEGWMLPAARERLEHVATLLDQGAEPLLAYSNAAVGARTLRYLLKPRDLVLPEPFGRAIDQAQRFTSRDPQQLSIVTFAFGIPPNALLRIEPWFRQYCLHVGDDRATAELDRFPLHVFRHAARAFNEPCSPLDLASHPGYLEGLRSLVSSPDWDAEIHLDIRTVEDLKAALHDRPDWNLVIELTDRIVRAAAHRPALARHLRSDPRLEPLRRRFFGAAKASTVEDRGIADSTLTETRRKS